MDIDDKIILMNHTAEDLLKLDRPLKPQTTWSDVRAMTDMRSYKGIPLTEDMDPIYIAIRNMECVAVNILVKASEQESSNWLNVTSFPVTDSDGKFIAGVATLFDVSEFKGIQDILYHKATHDPLTGLSNRTLFSANLCKEFARAKRKKSACALLVVDIDKFKRVNDSLGHAAGDDLLMKVANRISSEVRESDVVARLGGDEFAILLTDLSLDNGLHVAGDIADRICRSITNAFQIKDDEVYVSASIGISLYPTDGLDETAIFTKADAAMYKTKENGRNGWSFWEDPDKSVS
ncbi:MAG: sensor domain-containing diguanylate cyclase [Synergistaceae bacterium]|nr:sensor domain-containing diguanylate cyclase [Synergistaceae bacterium]